MSEVAKEVDFESSKKRVRIDHPEGQDGNLMSLSHNCDLEVEAIQVVTAENTLS